MIIALLLTISQAIAPALHAHVGGEHFGGGPHVHASISPDHATHAGSVVESIEGLVVGVAPTLTSRALKISARAPDDDASGAPPLPAVAGGVYRRAPRIITRRSPTDGITPPAHACANYLPDLRAPPAA